MEAVFIQEEEKKKQTAEQDYPPQRCLAFKHQGTLVWE